MLCRVSVAIENPLGNLVHVLLGRVFADLLHEVAELSLSHAALFVVVLPHYAGQQKLVLVVCFPGGICRVEQMTHNTGQQLDGDGLVKVVLEHQRAEDLFGRHFLPVRHFKYIWEQAQQSTNT